MTDTTITAEEWLRELEQLESASDEGMSVVDLVEKTGRSDRTVLKYLHIAKRRGWLRMGKRTEHSIDGRVVRVPVYRIVIPRARGGKTRSR